jgi:uncharacterized protein YoxC
MDDEKGKPDDFQDLHKAMAEFSESVEAVNKALREIQKKMSEHPEEDKPNDQLPSN